MFDLGLFLTCQAISRQLAAMPNEFYLIRLIHSVTRRPAPGKRLWTAQDLARPPVVRSLRERNELGFNVYVWPYAEGRNAGYIFLDLDQARPQVLEQMRTAGHEPCVVLQTSPGNLQAWVRVSATTLEPTLATTLGRLLAERYGGDRASIDWRHLGRLVGFANRKPARSADRAYWVQLIHAEPIMASAAQQSLAVAQEWLERFGAKARAIVPRDPAAAAPSPPIPEERGADIARTTITPEGAVAVYQRWLQRWRIRQHFPRLDWSIVDLWLARKLLAQHTPTAQILEILRLGSPDFPREHGNPEDYLRRTLARAVVLPCSPRPVCGETGNHAGTSAHRA